MVFDLPEPLLIALVRNDVVNHRCHLSASNGKALHAQRIAR